MTRRREPLLHLLLLLLLTAEQTAAPDGPATATKPKILSETEPGPGQTDRQNHSFSFRPVLSPPLPPLPPPPAAVSAPVLTPQTPRDQPAASFLDSCCVLDRLS